MLQGKHAVFGGKAGALPLWIVLLNTPPRRIARPVAILHHRDIILSLRFDLGVRIHIKASVTECIHSPLALGVNWPILASAEVYIYIYMYVHTCRSDGIMCMSICSILYIQAHCIVPQG